MSQMSPGWEKYWQFVISQGSARRTEGWGDVPMWIEEGGGSGRDARELSLTPGLLHGGCWYNCYGSSQPSWTTISCYISDSTSIDHTLELGTVQGSILLKDEL